MSKAGWAMDEHIRVSDADRESVVERLREHYAAGRLTSDELDERVNAALSAKNFGDLRAAMSDLPEPELVGSPVGPGRPGWPGAQGWPGTPGWQPLATAGRPVMVYRRGPRILPLVLIALVAAIVIPGGGWVFLAFLKIALLFGLVMCVLGVFAAAKFRRHVRRYWQSGNDAGSHRHEWRR
jgi:Domain of unknown function (DUF1707)